MTDKFSPVASFRTVKFNMGEFGGDTTGVHVWSYPLPCVLLRVPNEIIAAPDMWQQIHAAWAENWRDFSILPEKTCPECGAALRNSQRIWKGQAFCSMCGTRLTEEQSMGTFWIEVR